MSVHTRGFTLLETMIALVVLGIAALGALAGMVAASRNISDGQIRQYKTALAEAHAQSLMLAPKSTLALSAVAPPTPPTTVDQLPLTDSTVWKIDPSTHSGADANPIAYGALFTVTAKGDFAPLAMAVPNCSDATIPAGTLCREVAVTQGFPDGTAAKTVDGVPFAAGEAFTIWSRVRRVGEPAGEAVVHHEVFVQ